MSHFDLNIFSAEQLGPILDGYQPVDTFDAIDTFKVDFVDAVTTSGFNFGPKDYWDALKTEMAILICGNDADDKYKDLRKSISKQGRKSQTAVVSTIAVFIGSEIGIEAGLLTPFVALILLVAAKVGREAFCRALSNPED